MPAIILTVNQGFIHFAYAAPFLVDILCPGRKVELLEKEAGRQAGTWRDSHASLEDFLFLPGVTPKLSV